MKRGDIVEITFLDHSEGVELRTFQAYGRVIRKRKDAITIQSWGDVATLEPDDSTQEYTIAKELIQGKPKVFKKQ